MQKTGLYFIVLVMLFGCTPARKLKYTINEEGSKNSYENNRSEKTIQPYDYLYIKLYSLDKTTTDIFNAGNVYSGSDEQLNSYEVSDDGFIVFPFIGKIKVKDLTIDEARKAMETELNKYLTDISLRVRFVGNKITVLGEVRVPGNHIFFDEKITVFQALGLAGDVADYGDKTRVTLLREKNDVIMYHYLNLTEKNIVQSEFYYLLPNDIIIVDPVKAKYRSLQDRSFIFVVFSTVSTLTLTIISVLNYSNSQ